MGAFVSMSPLLSPKRNEAIILYHLPENHLRTLRVMERRIRPVA